MNNISFNLCIFIFDAIQYVFYAHNKRMPSWLTKMRKVLGVISDIQTIVEILAWLIFGASFPWISVVLYVVGLLMKMLLNGKA